MDAENEIGDPRNSQSHSCQRETIQILQDSFGAMPTRLRCGMNFT